MSPHLSPIVQYTFSLTSLLLSVSPQTSLRPCLPLPSSPSVSSFSFYLSIFCKLAALVRHRVSLFGKESAWWCYALSPSLSISVFLLNLDLSLFLFLLSLHLQTDFINKESQFYITSILQCFLSLFSGSPHLMLLSLFSTASAWLWCFANWGLMHCSYIWLQVFSECSVLLLRLRLKLGWITEGDLSMKVCDGVRYLRWSCTYSIQKWGSIHQSWSCPP